MNLVQQLTGGSRHGSTSLSQQLFFLLLRQDEEPFIVKLTVCVPAAYSAYRMLMAAFRMTNYYCQQQKYPKYPSNFANILLVLTRSFFIRKKKQLIIHHKFLNIFVVLTLNDKLLLCQQQKHLYILYIINFAHMLCLSRISFYKKKPSEITLCKFAVIWFQVCIYNIFKSSSSRQMVGAKTVDQFKWNALYIMTFLECNYNFTNSLCGPTLTLPA